VLDLTEQDFSDISNVTGRIFEIEAQRSSGSVSTVVCPNSEFLKQDLRGKHSWLNACSAKESSERIWHVKFLLVVKVLLLPLSVFSPGNRCL
jgi:hypothetical protein